jgi:hypothetical protein
MIFLVVLILFLVCYPYFHSKRTIITELNFMILMISGVSIFIHQRTFRIFLGSLAIAILIGLWFAKETDNVPITIMTLLGQLIFFSYILIAMFKYFLSLKVITLNKILAAICAYLVLGMIFAIIYSIIDVLIPGSIWFNININPTESIVYEYPEVFVEALYFSFVTLSTLGYGDTIPMLGSVKMISSLEAIFGQLFLAILIARLVGLHILSQKSS